MDVVGFFTDPLAYGFMPVATTVGAEDSTTGRTVRA